MNLLRKKIQVTKTARYFLSGLPSSKPGSIWFVCHGYGQLAHVFLEKFKTLYSPKNLVVAPEGFHRFYKKGFSGDVVASWMTKEERQDDIEDYIHFLDAVYEEVLRETGRIKINVLGFSQGTATVCRWLGRGKASADRLVLWGGGIPPDLSLDEKERLNKLKPVIVIGNQDEFISKEQAEEQKKYLRDQNINFEFISYEGKHDIQEDVLLKISEN